MEVLVCFRPGFSSLLRDVEVESYEPNLFLFSNELFIHFGLAIGEGP